MSDKDTRTYVTLDVLMPENHKIIELTTEACWLFIEALCYCGRNLTDGVVTAGWLKRYARNPEVVGELVDASLLNECERGFIVHDYLKHQRSATEVLATRERRSELGRAGGIASAARRREKAALERRTDRQPHGSTVLEPDGRNTVQRASVNTVEAVSVSVSVSVSLTSKDKNLLVRAKASNEVIRLCTRLLDALLANDVKQPALTVSGWLDPARLMLERDKRSEEQIALAIEFATSDEFWRSNVLSMRNLRNHYEQLQLKAKASAKPAKHVSTDSWMSHMPGQDA